MRGTEWVTPPRCHRCEMHLAWLSGTKGYLTLTEECTRRMRNVSSEHVGRHQLTKLGASCVPECLPKGKEVCVS